VYSLPLICIAVQDEMMLPLESGEGPLGLIVCPSRELASQTVEVITQYTDALKAVRRRGTQRPWARGAV
jgi:ATP-dependent RNA helicase DDX41